MRVPEVSLNSALTHWGTTCAAWLVAARGPRCQRWYETFGFRFGTMPKGSRSSVSIDFVVFCPVATRSHVCCRSVHRIYTYSLWRAHAMMVHEKSMDVFPTFPVLSRSVLVSMNSRATITRVCIHSSERRNTASSRVP